MHILGKVYFVGHTAAGGCRSSLSFCEFGFCYEVGLNKMAYAGQGERLHVISEVCVCMCV